MKQFLKFLIVCLLIVRVANSVMAQDKYTDSLKTVLGNTAEPVMRFGLINKIELDYWFSGKGNIDSAYVMQMLDIALQLDNDSLKAIAYDWIGEYYQYTEVDYEKSLEYCLKGVPLAEKVNDHFALTILYTDISTVYASMNIPAEALVYARKGAAALPDRNDPNYAYLLLQVNTTLASYFPDSQPDSQLHYWQAVKESNIAFKSPKFEGLAMGGLGHVYKILGNVALAESYFKEAITLANANSDFYFLPGYQHDFATLLFEQKRYDEAKDQAIQSFTVSQQSKSDFGIKEAASLLKNIYDHTHKTDSAYYYSQIELTMTDSVFNHEKLNRIHGMAFTEQIRLKEDEEKRAEQREQQQQNIQYSLIALGIIVFIILFLVLSHSFVINARMIEFLGVIALLIVFEFLNLLLHPFLERITHHTPLFMLLAMVCLAALVVPLHHRLEKWAIHRLVEKNKQVRLAAAKKTIEQLKDKEG